MHWAIVRVKDAVYHTPLDKGSVSESNYTISGFILDSLLQTGCKHSYRWQSYLFTGYSSNNIDIH